MLKNSIDTFSLPSECLEDTDLSQDDKDVKGILKAIQFLKAISPMRHSLLKLKNCLVPQCRLPPQPHKKHWERQPGKGN